MSDGERRDDERPTSSAAPAADDDDDDEDYEESGGGNHFLGFMFGNVDDSGDLDADYLDEDAKEHLFALADKLAPSLKDINLIKPSSAPTDPSEQDYDEKAEDAVDYEDIDEEYDGPEVEATAEEDHLLSKKDYLSSNAVYALADNKISVFDEENYDEDEEPPKDDDVAGGNVVQGCPSDVVSAEQLNLSSSNDGFSTDKLPCPLSEPEEHMDFEYEDFQQEETITEEEQIDSKSRTALPVLCIEDGNVILRFSEIFGIQEPIRKARKDHHKHSVNKELQNTKFTGTVEEDEEVFLRSAIQDFSTLKHVMVNEDVESDTDESISDVTLRLKDSCLSEQPLVDAHEDILAAQHPPIFHDFYPLVHEDWENDIVWGNSPATDSQVYLESSVISEESVDIQSEGQAKDHDYVSKRLHEQSEFHGSPVIVKPFGSREMPASANYPCPENSLMRQETLQEKSKLSHTGSDNIDETAKVDAMQRLNKLSLLNNELLEGSWLDNIIWDPSEDTPKPKLILDLKDDQMLFEILDEENGEHLRSHASAMIVSRSMKTSIGENFDHNRQAITSGGRFNISNDKYYSNRKTSQQAKSHAKKRAFLGVKVLHSVPALKLQTMKLKLSKKEIANFHRPKAMWYPHENKIAAKLQRAACSHGTMTVILMSLGGKGIKLLVNAEETLASVKLKASKKLELKPSEKIKLFYSGKELQDDVPLALQNVRPHSILHVIRTEVHLWPKAQKLPGESKPLRPPGAFRKKSELSVKDGHVFLMEYCEERPLLLGNAGMGAKLCTYYQKTTPADQTAISLRSSTNGLGTVIAIDPADKSPFLGDIRSGLHQSCLETNMYRAPAFPHKVASTDYLLVRSAKGMLSLRRIDRLYVVGQQEPHMEVFSPGTKNMQNYLVNRMLVYVYREFRAREKPGVLPQIRADDLSSQFPDLSDAIIRKRLKHCADLKRGSKGHLFWMQRHDFRIPSEEELRRLLAPESVCCYESMQAGQYRLKSLGIQRLTQPVGLASAMNQLPDEAIELAAAAHIERELQITSWNLTSNFVACTNQDRENIERLEITGVGDPSGRGLGFSYVRVTPKAPVSNSMLKKKSASTKGTTVTGTDADLRRLSMDAARELLLKFGVPEEQIDKLTRWHRIALVRKLSSEQAASGVTIDAIPVSKFARGQRMSFLQLQQQTREKCQEIWDRQVQSLSAIDGDDNDSDTEANSDLDSFAGDLENLLDAEEFDDEDAGKSDLRSDKADGMRGIKMRRCPSQSQTEEEIEDDEAEAALVQKMLEEGNNDMKKKNQPMEMRNYGTYNQNAGIIKKGKVGQINKSSGYVGVLTPKESTPREPKEIENSFAEGGAPSKLKTKKVFDANDVILMKKKGALGKDGFKEKRQGGRGESLICGACGQLGHMRTNKLCPKYGENPETSEMDVISVKSNLPDAVGQVQLKTPSKKFIAKVSAEVPEAAGPESAEKLKIVPVKFKCGAPEMSLERNMSVSGSLTSDKYMLDANTELKSAGKVNKIIISNKTKLEDHPPETPKPSVVIRPPTEIEKGQPRKKIIIKQPKVHVDQQRHIERGSDQEPRKMRKIVELPSFENNNREDDHLFAVESSQRNSLHDRRWGLKGKRRSKDRMEDESWRDFNIEKERQERRLSEARMYEARREEELQKAKKKKKKKKKHEFRDDDLLDHRPYRNDRRILERDRAVKRRSVVDMTEHVSSTKRRRGGEVELSNILERIVDNLRGNTSISYLFCKPVAKKDAPDYLDIINRPMDLGTIRDKVRKMEYKSSGQFRHDVVQIAKNAHVYNDQRNPSIPPLADALLELCDFLLEQNKQLLDDAEYAIED